ncbi:MAG: hypothetical protein IPI93_06815 [Sphingobacteriaceae bacterium]|nr:hypothetical protein [Sphingobacteriaceae bacterium]MBK7817587.1 hypothetical protein [Sphingobacteriaceae bacterium]
MINCCFIGLQLYENSLKRTSGPVGIFKIKDLDITVEKQKIIARVKAIDRKSESKKYYFINFWDAANHGHEDLTTLDTLIEPVRNDMAYILASGETNAYIDRKLSLKKIKTKNFIYLNNADSLLSAICQEKKMKDKFKFLSSFPMTIILDKKGNTIYFDSLGFFGRYGKDSLANCNRYFQSIQNALQNLK